MTGGAQAEGMFYLGLGFLAVGSALATPCLTALVSLYTPADRQGEVLGTFRSLGALSRAVAPFSPVQPIGKWVQSIPTTAPSPLCYYRCC